MGNGESSGSDKHAPAFDLPLRVQHYDGRTVIEGANGDELCAWGHASDWQKEVASQFVDSINAGGVWVAEGRVNVRPHATVSAGATLDDVTVEFDPDNNFCFKRGSKWVPVEDVLKLLASPSSASSSECRLCDPGVVHNAPVSHATTLVTEAHAAADVMEFFARNRATVGTQVPSISELHEWAALLRRLAPASATRGRDG